MRIAFDNDAEYQIAAEVVSQSLLGGVHELNPVERVVAVQEPVVGALLERLARHAPTVLPVLGTEKDIWLLVGLEHGELAHSFQHVARFLIPSYASLPDGARIATYSPFKEEVSLVHNTARICFDGYYAWHSPVGYRSTIMSKIGRWADLEGARPAIRIDRPPTYSELLTRFESALAAMDWPGARATLAELRQLHLVTAENLAFLRIQLLAEQRNWREIWEDPDYILLAGMRVPRRVRSALISAFHFSVLMPLETKADTRGAIERFKQTRGSLGTLLNGRFDLTDSPVVRVFGYQAVVAEDRPALETLLALKPSDEATRACLAALLSLLPVVAAPPLSSEERLRLALRRGDYDAAAQAATEQETRVDRALAWLRIAVSHADAAPMALEAYETLSRVEQAELEAADPAADYYLERILSFFRRTVPEIRTWHAWFEHLVDNPNDPALEIAREELGNNLDDRDWNPGVARTLTRDIERLMSQHEVLVRRTPASRALDSLVNQALRDKGFPRPDEDYAALYDALYTYLIYAVSPTAQNCAKLLRLADAVLQTKPLRLGAIAQDLQEWLASPKPTLEGFVLEAFELLVEHGLARGAFSSWYRTWVTQLLDLPLSVSWDRTSQETWLAFGEWLQPGDDLLLPLRRRLATVETPRERDALLRLPAGYRIGVFTLQRSSAERAKELILGRNPSLDIRLCYETDMNSQVVALAKHVDMAVVVATCITHAITYGIRSYLRHDPIYPVSRGSSSIVRALENHVSELSSSHLPIE